MKVLLTGATGFVGQLLSESLASHGHRVRVALRKDGPVANGVAEKVIVGEIGSATDWRCALSGVDAVIHLAARAHILHERPTDAHLYEETNAAGTHKLAVAAAGAGVCRFVYLSTVKVNGEMTTERAYSASDIPKPIGAYAASKWHGEKYVLEAAKGGATTAVIVRPPLVYGPGVRANFLRLIRWVDLGFPIPLGSVRNVRSLVSTWNLCDLLVYLLGLSEIPTHTWMVSDGEDLSTPELALRIGRAMKRKVRLVRVPLSALERCARMLGKGDEIGRLCSSLVVDLEPTSRLLGWVPPVTVEDGIARTVSWYLARGQDAS